MWTNLLVLAGRIVRHPYFQAAFFGCICLFLVANAERFTGAVPSAVEAARKRLEQALEVDPEAASAYASLNNELDRRALLMAAHSADVDNRGRSALKLLGDEMVATGKLPYRARLARLYLDTPTLQRDEVRNAFFVNHATACEAMELAAAGWTNTVAYCSLLEQARQVPAVWQLVWDDPLALLIWSRLSDSAVRFYHRNRDWLAEPLSQSGYLDMPNVGTAFLEQSFQIWEEYEDELRSSILEGDIGFPALAVVLSHGELLRRCHEDFQISPEELIPVIAMNPDMLGVLGDGPAVDVDEMAAFLAQVKRDHPSVWLAAGSSPLALRLYRDAAGEAEQLLEAWGYAEIPTLIYESFEEPHVVRAAARAINRFGDLALYVFSRYQDEAYREALGRYLTDEEVGIRFIPFVVAFEDEAFERVQKDKDWVDRYYDPDGRERGDPLAWMQYVPGGSAAIVVRNWAKGDPNEWSELGWAALDVADAALLVASLGTSKAVTGSAQVAGKAGRAGAKGTQVGSRANAARKWGDAVRRAKGGSRVRLTQSGIILREAGERVMQGGRQAIRKAQQTVDRAVDGWRSLSPTKKRWVYRGALAGTLWVKWSAHTEGHFDEVAQGVGRLLGDAAAGVVTLAGEALAAAATEFAAHLFGFILQQAAFWLVVVVFLLLAIQPLWRHWRDRPAELVVEGADKR